MDLTTWPSPNGQRFQVHRDAVPLMEPFFSRLNELYPQYQSLGGHAHRPMRTLDGRNLGGLSTHASGYTVDVKAPDHVLKQLAQEFPSARWGGNFKNHYDPVHFEFKPGAAPVAGGTNTAGLTGAQPMALSNAWMQPDAASASPHGPQAPGYIDRVTQSPLFLMGASVLGSDNVGDGMMKGAQAASAARMNAYRGATLQDELDQKNRMKQIWGQVQGNPQHPLWSGVPEEFKPVLSVLGPEDGMKMLQNYALTKNQAFLKQQDPMYQAQLGMTKSHAKLYDAQATKQEKTPEELFRLREQEAAKIGLTAADPAYRSYVLTGKMPREDQQPLSATDKKAIQEADESVLAANEAIRGLGKAMELSKTAYSGPAALMRGKTVDSVVPWNTPQGSATVELDQVVNSQALAQLKSIFGAAPTEGERKILLDIQGSVGQSQRTREEIYARALDAAKRRLEFHSQRANELRGQTYYKPQGGGASPPSSPSSKPAAADPLGIR